MQCSDSLLINVLDALNTVLLDVRNSERRAPLGFFERVLIT